MLGKPRNLSGARLASLAHPLLDKYNSISEDDESVSSEEHLSSGEQILNRCHPPRSSPAPSGEPPPLPRMEESPSEGSPHQERTALQTPPMSSSGLRTPYSPGRPGWREGVWCDSLDMRIILEPVHPFLVMQASPDWLAFCGFEAAQVRGRSLRLIQGSHIERHCLNLLMAAARKGEGTEVLITNYTKVSHTACQPLFGAC